MSRSRRGDWLLFFLGCSMLVVVVLGSSIYLAMPTALRTWPTGECVGVDDPAAPSEGRDEYTCDTLPERHHTEWVER